MRYEEAPAEMRDFRNFLFLVWDFLGLPAPTKAQYRLAEYLELYDPEDPETEQYRKIVFEGFRGLGKSWILAAYCVFLLWRDQSLNILVVSATLDKSSDFSRQVLLILENMPEVQHLAPRADQRSSTLKFDVNGAPVSQSASLFAVPVFGNTVGQRADVIITDDIEVANNCETVLLREKLWRRTEDLSALLKPEGPRRMVNLGTPHTEETIHHRLVEERGYAIRVYPCRYPDQRLQDYLGDYLHPDLQKDLLDDPELVGHATDPERFDDEFLLEKEAEFGRSGFALQFQLDTSLADENRYPLKLTDLPIMDLDTEVGPEKVVWGSGPQQLIKDAPLFGMGGDRFYRPMEVVGEYRPYQGSVLFIDPAGRGKDETAYAVVKSLNNQLFVLACGGLPGGYSEETLRLLSERAKEHQVSEILVESNFGDGMFTELLKPVLREVYPCSVEEIRHSRQKELRIIDTLEPVMAKHRLIVDRSVVEANKPHRIAVDCTEERKKEYTLFHQMTRLTKERGALRHDDRLDALAGAVAYYTERWGEEADQAIENRKARDIEEGVEEFWAEVRHQHGVGAKPALWC